MSARAKSDEVMERIVERMISRAAAERWFREHRIGAFGYRTAEELVAVDMADAVIEFLDGLDSGVHG